MTEPKYAVELLLSASELETVVRSMWLAWGMIDAHPNTGLFTDEAKWAAGGVMYDIISQLVEEQELLL